MNLRTDLVEERRTALKYEVAGTKAKEKSIGDCRLLEVDIETPEAAEKLGKGRGKYFTLTFPKLDTLNDTADIEKAIVYALRILLPETHGNVMVVGLGNTDITPDALGPLTANKILATRHLKGDIKQRLGLSDIKSVSVLIPGVLGKTGMEAALTVSASAAASHTEAIIVIDALAAAQKDRLCTTIQLSDSGISPGSGVKNSRKEISKKTLEIPVIAIGMPTVTDAYESSENSLMVTPKEIDLLIKIASELMGRALNRFLQPDLSEEIITALS